MTRDDPTRFPNGFLWGVSTSGYQVEGAPSADGKGASIWDVFAHRPGSTLHGAHGDIACNQYDRRQLAADLDLARDLGLSAFIFSVQWPRIQPSGRGDVDERGLDYYRFLVDGLRERGIEPVLTLYHWELPQALQDGGGWLARDTVDRFADYAAALHRKLADRVTLWITQNEPYHSAWLGHGDGKHAPGLAQGPAGALSAAHHLLLSHGRATAAMRAGALGATTRIGLNLNLSPIRPADPGSPADRAAARRLDGEQCRFFLDAVFHGRYPADVRRAHAAQTDDFAFVHDGDLPEIAAPLDFLAVNYYTSLRVARRGGRPEPQPAEGETTAMGWAIDPAGLGEVLRRVRDEYTDELPLILSETGASFHDVVDPEGACPDPERIDFLRRHVQEARAAIAAGVPLKGLFVWSLLDNFEWDNGYRERFGLVHVDYPTQRRTPKASFEWLRGVIAANGLPDEGSVTPRP